MNIPRDRQIFEDMKEGYYETDLSGNVTYVNSITCKIACRSSEEMLKTKFTEYTTRATARRLYTTFNKAFVTGIPQRIEYEIILKDNSRRVIDNSVSILKDSSGNLVGFCGLISDITKRKRLEEQLRENREQFESLFENANELIITTDAYGYIKRLNKKVEEISGYSRRELVGQSILMIAHPDDRSTYIDFWKRILEGQTPRFEIKAVSRQGKEFYLLASGSAIKKKRKIVEVQYNAQEISELILAQQTIEDLKNYLSSVFESSPNLVICLDRSGKVVMANPITERIFQVPVSSIIGQEISGLSPQMASLEKLIQDVQTERSPQFLHEQTLSQKSPRFFDISIYPLMNPAHGGVVFTAVDITEKKNMELQLIHAQKMETIGELAGGVAHDFNNILTGLSGNISMLKYTKDATKQQHYIQTLENITDRARDLIQQMLVFTKRHEGRPSHIPIKEVLHDVLDMTSKSFPKHIRMEITGDSREHIVFLDRTHLTQVFLNLVVNAKDAIGNKQDGTISIDISSFVADKNSKRQYLLGSLGKYVKIDIRDNGCGMNDEILSKVFNPFFTTKQKGTVKGTGLGLSIAYNIVKNAGGSIHVQSEEGRGTIFSVLIPVSGQKHASLSPDDRIKHSLSKQSARILIVDDEDMLREIGKEMLNLLGHSVETVSNGRECIEVLSKDSKRFDLVILDMIMPDLDGYHTLQEMQKQNITTKVIISSGYSFEHEQGDILANPLIIAKLNKPFNMKELSEVLEDALS